MDRCRKPLPLDALQRRIGWETFDLSGINVKPHILVNGDCCHGWQSASCVAKLVAMAPMLCAAHRWRVERVGLVVLGRRAVFVALMPLLASVRVHARRLAVQIV